MIESDFTGEIRAKTVRSFERQFELIVEAFNNPLEYSFWAMK